MKAPVVDRDLAVRALLATACVAFLFVVRWDSSLQHFDFQVWRAAGHLAEQGADPYDGETLNRELHDHPDLYGDHWRDDRWQTDWRMHLFNPPVWLTELRLLGNSALVMSLAGAALAYASVVILSRARPLIDAVGYLVATTWVFLFPQAVTTFRLGQSGLFLSGLVGAALVLAGRQAAGAPLAALWFKPHIAAAVLLPEWLRGPSRRRLELLAPSALLVAATVTLFPLSLWGAWLRAVFSPERPAATTDMSLRTLSPRYPVPESLSTITVVVGVAIVAWCVLRWRRADPRLLTLLSLSIVIYSSGHAFGHDWLWIVFIPVVGRWSLGPTMFAAIGAATLFTVGNDWAERGPVLVNLTSVLALAATLYLVVATRRSAAATGAVSPDDTAPDPVPLRGIGSG